MLVATETKLAAEVKGLRAKVNGLEQMVTELKIEVSELEETVQQQGLLLDELNNRPQTNRKFGSKTTEIDFQPTTNVAILRTCHETRASDPSLTSGMYWIDPDGQGVGDEPIYVYCDMVTGKHVINNQ